jgi:predicted RNase H-like nuclease
MSIQTWGILAKIREVDAAMSPERQARIGETHPELVYAAMNGGSPLQNSKKTVEGRAERRRLLLGCLPGAETILRAPRAGGAAQDDLLDAAALLWSAERQISGEALRLPELPEFDERGLRMEIRY